MSAIEYFKNTAEELARSADSLMERIKRIESGDTTIGVVYGEDGEPHILSVGNEVYTKYFEEGIITGLFFDDGYVVSHLSIEIDGKIHKYRSDRISL